MPQHEAAPGAWAPIWAMIAEAAEELRRQRAQGDGAEVPRDAQPQGGPTRTA